MPTDTPRIGTAGWTIPSAVRDRFPAEGAGLQRYAGVFDGVEINSTFYRPHRPTTFARWVEVTPAGFQFAVKLPKAITHDARLAEPQARLAAFRADVALLGDKLGPLLIQLPPSLVFDTAVAERFFASLRDIWPEACACEPRNASWFQAGADALLRSYRVARVAADPARTPDAGRPGGWLELAYWRLHGSPRMYYSSYEPAYLAELQLAMARSPASRIWCIFDNTTSGAAVENALALRREVVGLGGT